MVREDLIWQVVREEMFEEFKMTTMAATFDIRKEQFSNSESQCCPGPEVIKLFSCSTQMKTKISTTDKY